MIRLKTEKDIEILKAGGKILANVVFETAKLVKPGASSADLDKFAFDLIKKNGATPSFLNYKPAGAKRPFPASICVSINDEIVHGIPNEKTKIIKDGDLVKIDAGIIYKGLFTDHAVTIPVGNVSREINKMVDSTKKALYEAIKQCKIGGYIGDIGYVVSKIAEKDGFTVIEELTGHGVGYAVHEEPFVPNYGEKGGREKIEEGLVIAIEPMFSTGSSHIKVGKDGHTYLTADGSLATQFEHTVAITKNGPVILTSML